MVDAVFEAIGEALAKPWRSPGQGRRSTARRLRNPRNQEPARPYGTQSANGRAGGDIRPTAFAPCLALAGVGVGGRGSLGDSGAGGLIMSRLSRAAGRRAGVNEPVAGGSWGTR